MAKIKLTETGFSILPEGPITLKIVGVKYDEDFGKMEVEMQSQSGQKHTERFSLIKQNGEPNEGALKAFSYFSKTALNNFNLDEIDDQDLVGCYVSANIKHEQNEYTDRKTGELKTATNVRLNDLKWAGGFGGSNMDPIEDDSADDLDDFLND